MDESKAVTVGRVVGENLRRVREARRQTQPDAARHLQASGLQWTRDNIASLESGRRDSVGLEDLLLLSFAYAVPLAEWFAGDDEQLVGLAPDFSLERERVRGALRGGDVEPTMAREAVQAALESLMGVSPPDEADFAVAERFQVNAGDVLEAARLAWGRTLTEERDHRLGDVSGIEKRSLQARRGRMTRKLADELEPAIRVLAEKRRKLAGKRRR